MHPAYFQTVFEVDLPSPRWPENFAIISAHATTGEVWSDTRNQAADDELHRLLSDRCGWINRVTGASPDGSHCEPSWACELGVEDAIRVGKLFAQDAIYVVRTDTLSVVSCEDGGARVVGPFRERLREARA